MTHAAGFTLAAAYCALLGACSGDPPPPSSFSPTIALAATHVDELRAAGSGVLAPLVLALGAAWEKQHSTPRIIVEASIGSGGGIRAATDGAVDIGLVSRALDESESGSAVLRVIPLGIDAVVVAAHVDVSVDDVRSEWLRELVAGTRHAFADGTPATMLLRDRSESANFAMDGAVAGLAAARETAYLQSGRPVYYRDQTLLAALATTPGGIGFTSLALLNASRLPHKVLRLDGATPSPRAAADGTWRAVRPLAFVVRKDRSARLQGFLDFAVSAEGRRILVDKGYALPDRAPAAEPGP